MRAGIYVPLPPQVGAGRTICLWAKAFFRRRDEVLLCNPCVACNAGRRDGAPHSLVRPGAACRPLWVARALEPSADASMEP